MKKIDMNQFAYDLPEDRIAKYPLEQRSDAKLLVYKDSDISETTYRSVAHVIPGNSFVVRNTTRVMNARIRFQLESERVVEVFCLEPETPYRDMARALATQGLVTWYCLVGNNRHWKSGVYEFDIEGSTVTITRGERSRKGYLVQFEWKGDLAFGEILDAFGKLPIPPYMNRDTEDIDTERYQTVFANTDGAVAAPTASLHFTDEIFDDFSDKGIEVKDVILHVGAGTFAPVKGDDARDHEMHAEVALVTLDFCRSFLEALRDGKVVTPIGTTAMRTLESLYWLGVDINQSIDPKDLTIQQWRPYQKGKEVSAVDAIQNLVTYAEEKNLTKLSFSTQIMITPGYRFEICDAMFTNFHQPRSTLLLLISAFVGDDWKKIYDYALQHDFRFLSYGDGSYLVRKQ